MKIVKILGISLLGLIVLVVVASLFFPDRMKFERSLVMSASPDAIYEEVANFEKWEAWSPWIKMDPTIVNAYEHSDLGPNTVMKWTSTESGDGLQTITEMVKNEKIVTKLNFSDWPGDNFATWTFEEVEGGTKVTWSMNGAPAMLPFRPLVALMQGTVEKSYDMGLAAIKEIAEKKPSISWEEVTIDAPRWAIAIRDTISIDEMATIHGKCYGKIATFLSENNIEIADKPLCVNHGWDPKNNFIDLELAIPVADSIAVGEGMNMCQIPAQKAMMYRYYGAYDAMEPTYEMLFADLQRKGIELSGPSWEIYVTDPMEEKDQSKVETDLYFPI
ncbi:MAG: SRPBCC family protein [Salibacteraceae bacterium]